MLFKYVLPYIIYFIYSAIKLTWRIEIIEPESMKKARAEKKPMVFAHWHGDEIAIIHLFGIYHAAAMVSTSKDGDLMDKCARLFGAHTVRGSSTRGGVSALRGILRASREGWSPSISVDGPKGPYHKAKAGVFEISKITGGVIFPVCAATSRAKVFEKSWNKMFLPMPFARVVCVWGEPLPAVARDADAHDPDLARTLEAALTNAGQHARNLIAAP
jgi:lysophospholipid acyltransferase (LPLAT)-like uncharacterized protein